MKQYKQYTTPYCENIVSISFMMLVHRSCSMSYIVFPLATVRQIGEELFAAESSHCSFELLHPTSMFLAHAWKYSLHGRVTSGELFTWYSRYGPKILSRHALNSRGKQMSSDCVLFLEKIASMFEAIAQIIPHYQQICDICKRNGSKAHGQAEDYHLAILLSYVYADLVQLFLELYQIFCRGSQGTSVRCFKAAQGV